jgi:histidinol-phosphate aminotransferase
MSELADFPNLIIIQTLSKAYAMAGLRIGMILASAEIIEVLNKIKPPYNINISSQEIAEKKVLQNTLEVQVRKIKAEREKLIYILENIGFVKKIFPSDANFVLVKVDDAAKRYDQLIQNGIVVRNRSNQMLCENCLRISIGTKEENEILIKTLKKIQ